MVRAGAVGPGGDDDEVDGDVPGGADRRGDVGGRPRPRCGRAQPLAHPQVHGVDRGAGLGERRDLGRGLTDPQLAQHVAGEPLAAPGSAARRARTCSAHIRSASPTAATGPSRAATTSGYGSVPSGGRRCARRWPARGTPRRPGVPGWARSGSARPRRAAPGRSAAPGVGVVAGQVAQVRAGGEQQRVEAGGGGGAPRGGQPVRPDTARRFSPGQLNGRLVAPGSRCRAEAAWAASRPVLSGQAAGTGARGRQPDVSAGRRERVCCLRGDEPLA